MGEIQNNNNRSEERGNESLRSSLRKELHEHMAFRHAAEDSLAYTYAADALMSFAERGLNSAKAVEKELNRQREIPTGDSRRMPEEDIAAWERMLTEVETWAIAVPNLLQQSRVVQYDPAVNAQLWSVFDVVHTRDQMLNAIDLLRFRALKGSDKNSFSPFEQAVPPEFYELSVIATTQWLIRESIRIHPLLLDQGRKADLKVHLDALQMLQDTELEGTWDVDGAEPDLHLDAFIRSKFDAAFFRENIAEQRNRNAILKNLFAEGRVRVNSAVEKEMPSRVLKKGDTVTVVTSFSSATERVGTNVNATKIITSEKREQLNAERVTQNLPAAAEFAFHVQDSMHAWFRLLSEVGGTADRKRYARNLGEDVERFRLEILEKEAFEQFKSEAENTLKDSQADNEKARKLLRFFTWFLGKDTDIVSDRLTTSPAELKQVYDEVMPKVESAFDEVGSAENRTIISNLQKILKEAEEGNTVDEKALDDALRAYGALVLKAGRSMLAVQAWQTSENVQRVGGMGDTNNLDLVTRVGNKSFTQWAADFSPYGFAKTLSFRDSEGRIVIVDAGPSFSERSWSHIWEMGKFGVQHAALSLVLTHILTKMHYLVLLVPGLHAIVKALGVRLAVVASGVGNASLASLGAWGVARYERIKAAGRQVDEAVTALIALKKNEKKLSPIEQIALATTIGQKLRSELTVLLSAAEGGTDMRSDLWFEAHLYSNQILMAIGYPPLAELDASGNLSEVTSVQDLRTRVNEQGYDAKISPELALYIEVKGLDAQLKRDQAKMDDLRQRREEVVIETEAKLADLKEGTAKPKKSNVRRIIDEEDYPSTKDSALQSTMLLDAAHSRDMDKHYTQWTTTDAQRNDLIRHACLTILFDHAMKTELQSNVHYKGKPGYKWIGWIPGPHQYIPDEYRGDQRHILTEEKKKEWNQKSRDLVRVPIPKVLAAARLLEEHPPSASKIEELIGAQNAKTVEKLAGGSAMSKEFIHRFTLLRQYADKYAPPVGIECVTDSVSTNTKEMFTSLQDVLDRFPSGVKNRSVLERRMKAMYGESFRKQKFLQELSESMQVHGGAITEKTAETIYHEMRILQERGLFGYIPRLEKRE